MYPNGFMGMDREVSNMEGGDEQDDTSDSKWKKKKYYRHTARQIQELEAVFKVCQHPDEKQRLQLSRDLGLDHRQIKFWFQNRRTQLKAQMERSDSCVLRSQNDRIRCENIAMREALKNVICPSCGGPPIHGDLYYDEQKLRMENAHLKEELERVSNLASKYIGRPLPNIPTMQSMPFSSLDLSVGTLENSRIEHSLNLDHLSSSPSFGTLPLNTVRVSENEKAIMAEVAANAMSELIQLLQTDAPLWIKSPIDGQVVLDLDNYDKMFPKVNHTKNPNIRTEASRDSISVIMNALSLVDMFMDPTKWSEMFPTIVSKARTIQVLSARMEGTRSSSLQLMYGELQVLSPLVTTREYYFLRYCQEIEQGLWVIGDVSFDFNGMNQITSLHTRRLPSGCLIQDMPNGYSKVIWVEHVEVEEKGLIHQTYRDIINSGMAFGAQRWVSTLQRMCERFACLMITGPMDSELGAIPSPNGRRNLMKLSQRMVRSFCTSLSTSNDHRWTTLAGSNDVEVRVTIHRNIEPGQTNGVILSAATSLWLPISWHIIFDFLRDKHTRSQWDVLTNGSSVQEVGHIANGSNPGNCISILRALAANQNNMLILQESCIDPSGALVVYSPIDLPSINIAMNDEDSSSIPLLPSGFSVSHDGHPGVGGILKNTNMKDGIKVSNGSLITVVFQILVSNLPSAKMNLESVNTVNNLISTTVQQIKAALNLTSS